MLKYRLCSFIFIFVFCFGYAGCAEASPVEERVKETERDHWESIETQEHSQAESEEQQELYQEETGFELTDEHDRQMLALMEESCGFPIDVYAGVDMDKDGEREMIGVANGRIIWYCSSDLESCYEVIQVHYYDACNIEVIEYDKERHVVVNAYNMIGTGKAYTILALHGGEVEVLVEDNYGYVYMNEENDIILDIESYDAEYDVASDIWLGHTWKDTYLYYEDGKYKEYGAAILSEEDFLKYDNAGELLDEIEEKKRDEHFVNISYSYFIRENGIVIIQCELERYLAEYDYACIEYFHYTFRENGNHLDGELNPNDGSMLTSFSRLEVTYP